MGNTVTEKTAMGIDLGTSGVKVAVYNKKGEVIAAKTEEYPLLQPQNGYAEQNPIDWWNATKKAIAEVVKTADVKNLCGIGLSGQMHGLVMLDDKNEVIRPAILWCDARTGEQALEIDRLVGSKKLLSITANPAVASFTAAKLLWVRENEPKNYEKTAHVLLPKDYIRFKLCGVFATDVSDASGTQLLDIKNRCWSDEVLNLLSIDKALLPKMYESQDITGEISENTAKECSLPLGLPVVAGGGDNACAAVGTGVVENGKAFTTIGTSGVLYAHTSNMLLDKKGRIHTFCSAVKNEWHVMGVTQGAGLSVKWLRDTLCEQCSYKQLDELANTVPIGANRLLYLPYLMGERTPHLDPNARGVFFGLSAMHKRADIVRAVLEGVSYSLKDCLEIFCEMGVNTNDMAICGGGAKSAIWRRMLSDLYCCDLKVLKTNEGASLGAAILAFCGTGEYNGSVKEACNQIIAPSEVLTPNLEANVQYEKFYKVYTSLYPSLKESFNALSIL